MKSENFYIKDLTVKEQNEISGGNPIILFILTAIVGGIIYEVTKEIWTDLFDAYIDASKNGVYEGMPSPSFRH